MFSYTATMLINPILRAKAKFDALFNLEPIAQVGASGNLLIVPPTSCPRRAASSRFLQPSVPADVRFTYVRLHPERTLTGSQRMSEVGRTESLAVAVRKAATGAQQKFEAMNRSTNDAIASRDPTLSP